MALCIFLSLTFDYKSEKNITLYAPIYTIKLLKKDKLTMGDLQIISELLNKGLISATLKDYPEFGIDLLWQTGMCSMISQYVRYAISPPPDYCCLVRSLDRKWLPDDLTAVNVKLGRVSFIR
jgi:hypothetical protein